MSSLKDELLAIYLCGIFLFMWPLTIFIENVKEKGASFPDFWLYVSVLSCGLFLYLLAFYAYRRGLKLAIINIILILLFIVSSLLSITDGSPSSVGGSTARILNPLLSLYLLKHILHCFFTKKDLMYCLDSLYTWEKDKDPFEYENMRHSSCGGRLQEISYSRIIWRCDACSATVDWNDLEKAPKTSG